MASNDDFENPPAGQARDEDPYRGFSEPGNAGAESGAMAAVSELTAVSNEVLAARDLVEQSLLAVAAATGVDSSTSSFSEHGNIVGVGIGLGDPASGGVPGEPRLCVYVVDEVAPGEVRAAMAETMGVSAASDRSFPMDVVVTGVVDAQPHRWRERPVPGGMSVGHPRVTAGTIGCLARGRATTPRANRLLVLSNNHVLANSNNGAFGDAILQPGVADGGSLPGDQIAILERFVPINWTGPNLVDCATGWAWPDRVRRELVFVSGGTRQHFRIGSTPTVPTLGMLVGKSGRTTQLTTGRVTAIGVTVNVNYNGRVANFRDQIAIGSANASPFSAGGDSGSSIWTWDSRRLPVGLLFAGGGGVTFANRMTHVVNALDIDLLT